MPAGLVSVREQRQVDSDEVEGDEVEVDEVEVDKVEGSEVRLRAQGRVEGAARSNRGSKA